MAVQLLAMNNINYPKCLGLFIYSIFLLALGCGQIYAKENTVFEKTLESGITLQIEIHGGFLRIRLTNTTDSQKTFDKLFLDETYLKLTVISFKPASNLNGRFYSLAVEGIPDPKYHDKRVTSKMWVSEDTTLEPHKSVQTSVYLIGALMILRTDESSMSTYISDTSQDYLFKITLDPSLGLTKSLSEVILPAINLTVKK